MPCALSPAALLLLPCALLLGCRPNDFPEFPTNYREYAYVTNSASNTVTVLDIVNLRRDREFPVGDDPTGVAISLTRNEVYVVNSGSGTISVIDAQKNAVAATIPVHKKPYFIDVSQDHQAYVANSAPTTSPSSRPRHPQSHRHHRSRRNSGLARISPTTRPSSSPAASPAASQCRRPHPQSPQRLRRLSRSHRRRHPPRLLQGLHRLLRRTSGHGPRPRPQSPTKHALDRTRKVRPPSRLPRRRPDPPSTSP